MRNDYSGKGEDQGMNEKVQKALTALKRPNRLMSEEREVVIVYKDDLETLVKWVEENRGLDDEVREGDRVEVLKSCVGMVRGEIGTVIGVESSKWTVFPYTVNAGGVLNGKFARNELRKVEDG